MSQSALYSRLPFSGFPLGKKMNCKDYTYITLKHRQKKWLLFWLSFYCCIKSVSGVNEIVHWKRQNGSFFKITKMQTMICVYGHNQKQQAERVWILHQKRKEWKRANKSKCCFLLMMHGDRTSGWMRLQCWPISLALTCSHLSCPCLSNPLAFSIHPSSYTFSLPASFWVAESWCLSTDVTMGEARYSLDRPQDHHRAIYL